MLRQISRQLSFIGAALVIVVLASLLAVVVPERPTAATPSSAWGLVGSTTIGSNPTDIAAGTNDDLWITDSTDRTLTHLTSISTSPTIADTFTLAAGTRPTGVTIDIGGDVWVADSNNGTAIRFDENAGTYTEQAPISLALTGYTIRLTTAPDGSIWAIFQNSQNVQRLSQNGTWAAESLLTSDSYPMDFTVDTNGDLWLTNTANFITKAEQTGGVWGLAASIPTPYWGRLATTGPDGLLYMSDSGCRIYVYDPATQTMPRQNFPICGSDSIAATDDGSVFLTTRDSNSIVRWIGSTLAQAETIPTGGRVLDMTVTTDGAIWFINATTHVLQHMIYAPAVASTFTNGTTASVAVGTNTTFSITTTGGFPTPRIRELDPLPYGLTLTDNQDGTATISGAPALGSEGVYPIRLAALNANLTTTQTITITVPGTPPEQLTVFYDGQAGGWNTCAVNAITVSDDQSLWVSSWQDNRLLRYTTDSFAFQESFSTSGTPAQLIAASDGTLWFIDTTANTVQSVVETSGTWSLDQTITVGTEPRYLVAGANGSVWVADTADDTVTEITNVGGTTTVGTPISIAGTTPSGLTVGADGAIWVGDRSTGTVIRIAESGGGWGTEALIGLAGSGAEMVLETGPDGDIWVLFQNTTTLQSVRDVAGVWTAQTAITLPGGGYEITTGPDDTLWVGYPDGWSTRLIDSSGTWVPMNRTSARGRTQYAATAADGSMWWSDAGCALFQWRSANGVAPTITSPSSAQAVINTWSNIDLTATGNPQVTFSILGDLPLGMYLSTDPTNSRATIYGSPDGSLAPGDVELTVVANNGAYRAAAQRFTLTVLADGSTTTTSTSSTTTSSTTSSTTSTSTTSSTTTTTLATTTTTAAPTTTSTVVIPPALTEDQVLQLPPAVMTPTPPQRGKKLRILQRGFRRRERVQILVASDPIVLGEFDADDDGVVDVEVDIPTDLPDGTHHLVSYGLESGIGFSQEFVLDASDGTGSALPATGSNSSRPIGLAIGLLGIGAVLAVSAQRRRRHDS